MTNSMNNEISELLWKCGIKEKKHVMYIKIINTCLDSINNISSLFSERIGSPIQYELKIKTENTISPYAGPMWGVNLIIFQVKFIVELIRHYEVMYDFNVEISLNEQRQRRLTLAVCLAFFHELTHIMRGHNSTVINEGAPNNRGSKAAEADADFLAGMQLYKWFTGHALGSELQNKIGLKIDRFGLPVFFKDAGFCTVLLAFFLHNKFNSDNDGYHLPNIRAVILLAGFMNGAISPSQQNFHYVNFLFAGYKEHIQYLEKITHGGFDEEKIKVFLQSCPKEEKELLKETAKEMDVQRKLSDQNSEIWKALYDKANKNKK